MGEVPAPRIPMRAIRDEDLKTERDRFVEILIIYDIQHTVI
jgi:hypothetical protein